MTVVSNKKFLSNSKKYLDLAINQYVYIEEGRNMFIFARVSDDDYNYNDESDDDDDVYISKDEFRLETHKRLKKFFSDK